MAEGIRSPKLTVKAGKEVEEASVETTAGIPIKVRPSKYNGKNYQRLKVDITIPEGVKEATISFSAEAGEQPVYVDDFRCWEWLTAPKKQKKRNIITSKILKMWMKTGDHLFLRWEDSHGLI